MSMKTGVVVLALAGLSLLSGASVAETLLIERVQAESGISQPVRGQSMAQVEARYGAPAERLDPRGGQKRQWPAINRWVYPDFVVYFEKDKVIDVVVNRASAAEIGPKPPIR